MPVFLDKPFNPPQAPADKSAGYPTALAEASFEGFDLAHFSGRRYVARCIYARAGVAPKKLDSANISSQNSRNLMQNRA